MEEQDQEGISLLCDTLYNMSILSLASYKLTSDHINHFEYHIQLIFKLWFGLYFYFAPLGS